MNPGMFLATVVQDGNALNAKHGDKKIIFFIVFLNRSCTLGFDCE